MSVLLLRLAGPLQSWGDASRFVRRHTADAPTKSGVLGLLAAARGFRRTDPIEELLQLRFGVRTDQPGRLVRDFQTAQRWDTGTSMPLSYRYYLADAVFVAAIEGDDELIRGLDDALRAPTFPLYLGRRSCPPAGKLRLGVRAGPLPKLLRDMEWQASEWYRRSRGKQVDLDILVDADLDPTAPTHSSRDNPVSFDPSRRDYQWRSVARSAPVRMDNPGGRAEPDFFAALGGS